MAQTIAPEMAKYGHHIFIYNNIRTNQVIYSLTRTLNNNNSLKQLPFLGKKTVPAKLRKDLWHPLALVSFPSPYMGLAAYRKLREFRRLHETSYPLSLIEEKPSKTPPTNESTTDNPTGYQPQKTLVGTKLRGKILMNQKANSVADLAAVLIQQSHPPTADRLTRSAHRIYNATRLKHAKGASRKNPVHVSEIQGSVEGVRIRWVNLLDAEFAATWPEAVVHEGLQRARYAAAWPPLPDEVTERVNREREVMLGRVESGAVEGAEVDAREGRGAEALERVIKGEEQRPRNGLRERLFGGFGAKGKEGEKSA